MPMGSQEAEDAIKLLLGIDFSFRNALLIFFHCFLPFFVWPVYISFSHFLEEIEH